MQSKDRPKASKTKQKPKVVKKAKSLMTREESECSPRIYSSVLGFYRSNLQLYVRGTISGLHFEVFGFQDCTSTMMHLHEMRQKTTAINKSK
jgi:hypothetical protein